MTRSVAIIGSRGYPSYYGGFETLVRRLSPYLADCGWDVTVYGRDGTTDLTGGEHDPRVRSVTTVGIETRTLSTLSYGLSSVAHAAWKRPDVAFVMNVANGYWLPLLKARRIPTLVNVDGIEWERAKWSRQAKAVFRTGASLTARFGDQLVYDSQALGERWQAEFKRDGVFIPYGGTIPEKSAPRNELESGSYALMVARFVPENSIEEFFAAAELLSHRWTVVIVGSSGYGGEFDNRAESLSAGSDRIHWLGHINDDKYLFSLFEHAGVYFHGHSVGGTNPALVQAMACGAPVVARDTAFNREVLGEAGVFVEPESSAIARQLEIVLGDQALQANLRAKVLQRQGAAYTWEGVCATYEKTLRAMSRHGGSSTSSEQR